MKPDTELTLSPEQITARDVASQDLDIEMSGTERRRRFSRRTSEDLIQFQGAVVQRASLQMTNEAKEDSHEERRHGQASPPTYRSILKAKGSSRASSPERRVKFHNNVLVWAAAEDGDLRTVKNLLKSEKDRKESGRSADGHDSQLDINMSNHENVTLLHLLCFLRDLEAVKLVVALGADTNAVDREGWTPLHIAVALNLRDISTFLVESGSHTQFSEGSRAINLTRVSDSSHVKPLVDELETHSMLVFAMS